MHVCLLNDSFPPVIDGVANVVVNYAEVISRSRGTCIVATPEYPGAEDAYPFPVVRYRSLDTTRLVGYRAGVPFEPATLRALQTPRPDVIHTHCPVASTLLARALRERCDAPVVFTYHTKFDIDIDNAIRGELLQEAAVRMLVNNVAACDEVWVVSRGAGENLRHLGYTGEYRVMDNGVDMPRGRPDEGAVQAVTGSCPLPQETPVFLFVGRLMWYKGIRLILDGLGGLQAAGVPFRMVFIGAGGDEAEIRAAVSEAGLDQSCLFLGAIHDREAIRAWYSRADLLLFPSTFDTNGLVVREAAACGLPALLIRGSCAAEGVTDGETGILAEASPESITRALQSVCGKREVLRRIGQNAMDRLYLSWEDSVGRACDRYAELIEAWRQVGPKPRPHVPLDELFNLMGEVYEALDKVRDKRLERQRLSPEWPPLSELASRMERNWQDKRR